MMNLTNATGGLLAGLANWPGNHGERVTMALTVECGDGWLTLAVTADGSVWVLEGEGPGSQLTDGDWFTITGELTEARVRPATLAQWKKDREEDRRSEGMARSERAMQAGMAFGCQGYNDQWGY